MAALHLRTQRAIVSFTVLGLLFVAVGMAILGTGCGNKGDASASTIPVPAPTTTQAQQVPVSQAERELAFVEMVPKCKAVSNSQVVYYHFSYADREGAVHACELPKAMAEGKWTESAWHCTFQAYEVHQDEPVSKPVKVAQTDGLEDFPFVSPKQPAGQPVQQYQPTAQNAAQASSDPNSKAKAEFEGQILPAYVMRLSQEKRRSVNVQAIQYKGDVATFQVEREEPTPLSPDASAPAAGLVATVSFDDGTMSVFSCGASVGWHEIGSNLNQAEYLIKA